MTLPVVYRPEVRHDIRNAYRWYERQREGLGEEFLREVGAATASLSERAESHGVVYRDIRAALVERFPYVIYYRRRADFVEVLAVVHGRRSSRRWRKRGN